VRVGIVASLGIGITLLSGGTSDAAEANTPSVPATAAPTRLVPEAYIAVSTPVAPTPLAPEIHAAVPAPAAPVSPSPIQTRLLPSPAPVRATADRTAPAIKFNQYHPHWVVASH